MHTHRYEIQRVRPFVFVHSCECGESYAEVAWRWTKVLPDGTSIVKEESVEVDVDQAMYGQNEVYELIANANLAAKRQIAEGQSIRKLIARIPRAIKNGQIPKSVNRKIWEEAYRGQEDLADGEPAARD